MFALAKFWGRKSWQDPSRVCYNMLMDNNKVMIVGTGNVGASIAYALINQRTAVNEIVLTDIIAKDAEGEAMDLRDALAGWCSTETRRNSHGFTQQKCQYFERHDRANHGFWL